ncbi:hypothetical protein NP233_g10182 [Leucocoprinus birnbaumii]|uniref:Possible tRNA binding domain-containing protein n=1 Tax=Leucocoprinus birnbaumii TaxID=56174 RepID=A0AAD5VJQ6_9AGAR|nr:hypothetical protein NP233_g10182 [Leucocoprinus birnbaumii]
MVRGLNSSGVGDGLPIICGAFRSWSLIRVWTRSHEEAFGVAGVPVLRVWVCDRVECFRGVELGITKNTDRDNEKTGANWAITSYWTSYPYSLIYTSNNGYSTGDEGEDVKLSAVQSAILLAVRLQRKSVERVEEELDLPISQALALFVKIVKKITKRLVEIQKEIISAGLALPSGPPPLPTQTRQAVASKVKKEDRKMVVEQWRKSWTKLPEL